MSVVQEPEVNWTLDQMVEVVLAEPDDFLKVRETLTRIGVASRKEKKIYLVFQKTLKKDMILLREYLL